MKKTRNYPEFRIQNSGFRSKEPRAIPDSGFRNPDSRTAAKCLVLLFTAIFAAACAGQHKKEIYLTSEPSIQRAFDTLDTVAEGRELVDFLYKNPVTFEYSKDPGFCHKFSLKMGVIFLPAEFKVSDTMLALELGRAAYIYRLYTESGFDEIVAEDEEAAALFQARTAVEMNMENRDFEGKKFADRIKAGLCAYLLDGSAAAAQKARNEALSSDADCRRPYESMAAQRGWLEEIRKAINEETLHRLLAERDQQRVQRGELTQAAAMKNDADIRGMPAQEFIRFQRFFYEKQSEIFAKFDRTYRQSLQHDKNWRAANSGLLLGAKEEFSGCDMPR